MYGQEGSKSYPEVAYQDRDAGMVKQNRDLSPVESELQGLNRNSDTLHMFVTELELRLRPVLQVVPTAPNETSERSSRGVNSISPKPETLRGQIAELSSGVNGAANRIQSIIERLEI